tara:strand:+ start:1230 stop:2414 length:1185 start_codon:yes stop_codon:yes gene_type:complete
MYKPLAKLSILFLKKLIIIYILFFFNFNSFANENQKSLRVGLLAPFSGEYKDIGQSIMFSLQLALSEIGDENVKVFPRDSGYNNPEKLISSIKSFQDENINIVIGPINYEDFKLLQNFKDIIFISPSNIDPKIQDNILSVGVSLESQIKSIEDFIKKNKKKNTVIMYPKNKYTKLIDSKIDSIDLGKKKIFKYNPDPKILTSDIEKLTNYKQRKRNLISRVKILEEKDDEASKLELKRLEQQYTIGDVNFDSVIIIDFGDSLKSVLTSLVYSDVNQDEVLIVTVNQWFDKSIFLENSIKNLYYPSVDIKNFNKYRKKYSKIFGKQPSEITILTYDALGLIYYIWNKNNFKISSIKDFIIKDKIKGKIGTFNFIDGKLIQKLSIYKVSDKKFIKF